MIEDAIKKKIENLVSRVASFAIQPPLGDLREHNAACEAWLAEARNIIELAIPIPRAAYRRSIEDILARNIRSATRVVSAGAVLKAMLADVEAGLVGDLGNKIRAETFDDFLDHAEAYRSVNKKNEAGVIAGVVFEDAVRRVYREKIR